MVVYAAATAAYLFVVQIVIDAAAEDAPIIDYAQLILPFIIGIPLISAVSNYLQRVKTNNIALNAVADMQTDMFEAAISTDLGTLSQRPKGELISHFVSDVGVISNGLIRIIGNLIRDVLSVLFVIAAMLYQSWQLSLTMAVFVLALAPLITLSQKMRGSADAAQAHVGRITAQLKESFEGARLVRAYGLEGSEKLRLGKSFTTRIKLFLRLVSQQARVDPILEVLGGLAIAGIIIAGVWLLRSDAITPGQIGGVLVGMMMLAPRLRALGTINNVVQEMLASVARVFSVTDMRNAVTETDDATPLTSIEGHISFEGVCFAYPDGTQALNDLSLDVAPGATVALVGPSGGGKSTTLNLVPRFFDVTSGSVKIDGHDVRDLKLSDLRAQIALVSQNIVLFSDSVANNIGMGRQSATRDAIIEAAKSAAAHDFIMALPDGYDTVLGEDGDTLSGGQRQRIAIARALLRDAPILLLDEATSGLDAESEAKVRTALDHLREGRTTLVIAHRLSTIKGADRVYVIDQGRVVETGTDSELREKQGLFARLKSLQTD